MRSRRERRWGLAAFAVLAIVLYKVALADAGEPGSS